MKVDKVFCLCCYLFSDHVGRQGVGDAFVLEGFCSWNKMDRLKTHIGDVNSSNNKAVKKCDKTILLQLQYIIKVILQRMSIAFD